jgi:Jacalin-like lectin domain
VTANEVAGWSKSHPYGGDGGDGFSDDLTQVTRLLGFVIRSGNRVDSIQAIYQGADGTSFSGPQHGGNGGTQYAFAFSGDEAIIGVSGRAGSALDQISITTTKKTYGPFGGNGGDEWEFPNTSIGGIFGRSGARVDQIGFFYK